MNDAAAETRSKILGLDELADVIERRKVSGARVVLCHGVFDLLHVGHIRHFEEAKSVGDLLVVTLTEDRYVNKGPHRPAFTDTLRAEAVAALGIVDYVAVSRYPTAVEVITKLRPNVYAKGPDYRAVSDDVTGGIAKEEQAARAVGGTIHFTSGETFSSSALLNRHLPAFPAATEDYLRGFREKYSAADVITQLDRIASLKATVIGEAILDEYVYCDQMGKSAKDPVLAMRYVNTETFAGGSLAVANHLANFCKSVELITYLGKTNAREGFITEHLHPNVRTSFVYKSDSPTIIKRRYVEHTLLNKMFEVYIFNDEPMSASEEAQLIDLIETRSAKTDAIVVADFGHGLMTPASIDVLERQKKFVAVNTQINAANIRYHAISNYARADYVCINEGELRLDARSRRGPLPDLVCALSARMRCNRFLVTRGKLGVTYFDGGSEHDSPAFTTTVLERMGSGDAVLAITSLCAAADVPPDMVAFIANVIGAQKVQIIGNRNAVDRVATLKFVQSLLR